jgi:PAS domain S-box-containing protein
MQSFPDIMELAIEGSGIGLWDRNIETGEIHYSSSWNAILGYDASELSTDIQASYARVHPDDLAYVQQTIQDHFDRVTEKYEVEHRLRCKDGSYKWVLSRGRVVQRDAAGKALRMVGTTTDITSTRVLAEKLQGSIDLLVNLTNEMPGLVFQYKKLPDGHGCFPYASSRIGEIYEVAPEQVAGSDMPALQRIHPKTLNITASRSLPRRKASKPGIANIACCCPSRGCGGARSMRIRHGCKMAKSSGMG